MDFRNCPSCKASVLEEDAAECPFCGASMSGKPAAAASRPAAPKPAAQKPATQKPAGAAGATPVKGPEKAPSQRPQAGPGASRPQAGSAKPAAASNDADDPFDVDTAAVRQAIKLAPRVMKGRTYEVVCPMCETPGYMLPSDVGKDVHCCNPDCMVPVFKSKKPVVANESDQKAGSQKPVIIAAAIAGALLVGLGIWAFQPKSKNNGEDGVVTGGREVDQTQVVPTHDRVVQQAKNPEIPIADLKKRSLSNLLDRARQRERNRNIEHGYQQAAVTFAAAGDVAQATEQLKRLQAGSASAAYLQLQPLVTLGWNQLASGNAPAATATALDAYARVQNLPQFVRDPQEACVSLTALLVATGSEAEAIQLITREQNTGVRGAVATISQVAIDSGTFNYNDESKFVWHLLMPEPMRLGAVEILTCRNHADVALKFAGTGRTPASQSLSRAAWAARVTQFKNAESRAQITTAIQQGNFDQATQALIWSAVSDMEQYLKNDAASKSALEMAVKALSQVPQPSPQATPTKKEIHDSEGKAHFGLPDPAPAYVAAMAASAVGIVQLHHQQVDEGWANIEMAMDHFKGVSPSTFAMNALVVELARNESGVRNDLSSSLGIPANDDRLRRAFNRYRQQLQSMNEFAQQRIGYQVTILRTIAEMGDYQRVWDYALSRANSNDEQLRHNYLETSLPSLIVSLAQADGNTQLGTSIRGLFTEKPLVVDPLDQVYALSVKKMRDQDLKGAADIFEKAYRSRLAQQQRDALDAIAMRVVGELQSKGQITETVKLIQGLYDEVIQENLFLLASGYAVRHGNISELWHLMNGSQREYHALEFVSLYRGIVEGSSFLPAAP